MDALDLLLVLCAVAALGTSIALSLVCARVLRAARSLAAASAAFDDAAGPAIEALHLAARDAAGEVERIDALLEVATAIGGRVDSATEATYRALTSPVIKGVALASGTRRAAQRLRGHDAADVTNGVQRR